jgi:hypothetical protein
MTQQEIIDLAYQAGIKYRGFGDEFYTPDSDGVEIEQMQAFAKLVEAKFMDKLIAHPAIVRQIVDAGMLSSDPAGLKKRGDAK